MHVAIQSGGYGLTTAACHLHMQGCTWLLAHAYQAGGLQHVTCRGRYMCGMLQDECRLSISYLPSAAAAVTMLSQAVIGS
jgi:hypothetical protein